MKSLFERAKQLIPLGANTSSKAPCRMAEGFGPTHALGGKGCMVTVPGGKEMIDWAMGLGPVTIGHGHPAITSAVSLQAARGVAHTLPTELEVELAELLHDWIPGAEMVRFLKSGSDACAAAVRLARAFTGYDKIIRCGYHGWHDWAMNADYEGKKGIPQCVRDLTITVPFNDLEALEDEFLKGGVAGFILEPVSLIEPYDWYLPRVRDLCDRYGVVLIFDEVITGIRMGRGGAAEYFNVTPDLTCTGKGLANGFPLAAISGRRDIMQCFWETHISGTYNGETAALAASLTTLGILERENFWEHQRTIGKTLRDGYQTMVEDFALKDHTKILGMPHFTSIQWPDATEFTLFQQEMMRCGVLFTGSQFPCLAHNLGHVRTTCRAYRTAGAIVAEAIASGDVHKRLECKVNTSIFRRH